MNAGLIVIILLLVLSILGIPIYLALGIGTLVALNMADMPFIVLPQKLFAGMNSSSLLAIPFFMLAGNIMSRSITGKLIDVSNALIGWIKGSLAVVTVLASALFGAISGSGVATASAVGGTIHSCHEGGRLSRPFRSGDFRYCGYSGAYHPAFHYIDRICEHYGFVRIQAVCRLCHSRYPDGSRSDYLCAVLW